MNFQTPLERWKAESETETSQQGFLEELYRRVPHLNLAHQTEAQLFELVCEWLYHATLAAQRPQSRSGLHVWHDDNYWVIARNPQDASQILRAHGHDADEDPHQDEYWEQWADNRDFTFRFSDGERELTLPCRAWVELIGHGFLATSEV